MRLASYVLLVGIMMAGAQRWFFDAWAQIYDAPWVQWATYWPVHDAVVAALRGRRTRSILDIGCGTGQLTARLQREFPDARVVGCDFSAGMLARAMRRSAHGVWVQGDATRLPFRRGTFDAVVSTEAFHWFPDQPAALRELHRVLVPGGHLMLALVNPSFALVSELTRAGSRLIGQPFYWPTPTVMRQRMSAAGFRVDSQSRVRRLPGALLLPPVLTVAVRSGRSPRAVRP